MKYALSASIEVLTFCVHNFHAHLVNRIHSAVDSVTGDETSNQVM